MSDNTTEKPEHSHVENPKGAAGSYSRRPTSRILTPLAPAIGVISVLLTTVRE